MKPVLSLKSCIGQHFSLEVIGKQSKCMCCTEAVFWAVLVFLVLFSVVGKPKEVEVSKFFGGCFFFVL